jgi:pyrophosphate--fructose-6-phosphate 1-phosphotransferase
MQLLMDRDPHGNVQVSRIETERLFIGAVEKELARRKKLGAYKGKFSHQANFCGYEGRSCLPSNFDAQYCYVLGHVAALLLDADMTGYICCVQGLSGTVETWQIGGRSLVTMMTMEKRQGKDKAVITKSLVNLNGKPFGLLQAQRTHWAVDDDYIQPGPIQYFGPLELTDSIPITLKP